jgi:hypothetical protein
MARSPTTTQSLEAIVKFARDIMLRGKGFNDDLGCKHPWSNEGIAHLPPKELSARVLGKVQRIV